MLTYFIALVALASPMLKVAVVDTGIDMHNAALVSHMCPDGSLDLTGEGLADRDGHGTHVAGLIEQYAGDSGYCLVVVKYYKKGGAWKNAERFVQALTYAANLGVELINVSGGGDDSSDLERYEIESHRSTKFIVAAGNDGKNLDGAYRYYPASYGYSNIEIVGALRGTERAPFSNYGSNVRAWEQGVNIMSTLPGGLEGSLSGTSQATAIHTGKVVHDYIQGRY